MPNDAAGAPVRVNVFILVSKFLAFWTFMCFCERFSYEWEFTKEPQEKWGSQTDLRRRPTTAQMMENEAE